MLQYIKKVYFEFLKIDYTYTQRLEALLNSNISQLKLIAIENNINPNIIDYIDSISKESTMLSTIYLPYRVIIKLKYELQQLNANQQIIIIAYVTRWVSKLLVENGLDFTMDIEYYLKLINEAAEMGSKIISLGGFNDMFSSDEYLIPIMKLVKSSGMYGVAHTSGFIVNEALMEAMIDLSWDEINLSLHTTIDNIAKFLRGSKDYIKQVESFIAKFNRIKKKKNKKLPNINCVNVLNKFNYKEIVDMMRWVKAHEINSLYFNPMWLYSKESFDIKMENSDIEEFKYLISKNIMKIRDFHLSTNIEELLELETMHVSTVYSDPPSIEDVETQFKDYSPMLKHPCSESSETCIDNSVCPAPWFQIAIDNQGGPKLCANHFMAPFTSNIHTQSLSEIWYGEEFNLARRNYVEGKLPIECSRYCSQYPSFYIKKILEEYLGMKNFINSGQVMPESFLGIIS